MTPRLHILGLPHKQAVRSESACAYTTKQVRLVQMMHDRGWPVTLYAPGPTADVPEGVEHVPVTPEPCVLEDEARDLWDGNLPHWTGYNLACAQAVAERSAPGDILCMTTSLQSPVAVMHPRLHNVETGIGYEGTWSANRVFESYAWMHTIYGMQQGAFAADGSPSDTVIHNFFDPDDFPAGTGSGGYALYIGRLIHRKGVADAQTAAEQAGVPLIIAGTGTEVSGGYGEYVGHVGPTERAELMGAAVCTLVPTRYVEPFGGVAVESMLCGTPAVTTDWGAFTETLDPGVTGYRAHTPAEMAPLIDRAASLPRAVCRDRAVARFSTGAAACLYDRYLRRVAV